VKHEYNHWQSKLRQQKYITYDFLVTLRPLSSQQVAHFLVRDLARISNILNMFVQYLKLVSQNFGFFSPK
jgi:hypothetical protein